MSKDIALIAVHPAYALPKGEIVVECEGFRISQPGDGLYAEGVECRISAASAQRILAIVPDGVSGVCQLQTISGGAKSSTVELHVGRLLASDMHLVANPAVDPTDDS